MRIIAALVLCAAAAAGAGREVAITIDDLPRSEDRGPRSFPDVRAMTEHLLKPFRQQRIPVIGFVNGGREVEFGPENFRRLLDLWLDSGTELGNHSYSHLNINDVPIEEYEQDITRGEPVLRAALAARGRKLEFFRHPFLHTGTTVGAKKHLQEFLVRNGYRVAPVTLDNMDFQFAALYTQPGYQDRVRQEYVPYMESIAAFFENRCREVLGREVPQILIIDASQLNADLMPELLAMFQRRGYRFVSLAEALKDPAYQLPEEYIGPKGLSWIHRWAAAKGMAPKEEPPAPKWLTQAAAARSN